MSDAIIGLVCIVLLGVGFYFLKRKFESWLDGKPPAFKPRTTPPTHKETAEARRHLAVAERLIDNVAKKVGSYTYSDYVAQVKVLHSVANTLNQARRLDPTATVESHGSLMTVDNLTAQACWIEALNHKGHAEAYEAPEPTERVKESLIRTITGDPLQTTRKPTMSSKYFSNQARYERYQIAIDAINKALHYYPLNLTYLKEKVTLLTVQGNKKEAQRTVDDALSHFPDDLDLLTLRAMI